MVNNPFTILKNEIDPVLRDVSAETPLIGGPLLSILKKSMLKGVDVPESGIIEITQPYSEPCASEGDSWVYTAMQSKFAQGKVKFKKFTLQSMVSEDILNRMEQIGPGSLHVGMKGHELKSGVLFLRDQIARFACDPWGGVTTSGLYDVNIVGLFAVSTGGTISNPSSLDAGTAVATGLSMSGANQSTRVVEKIAAGIKKAFVKIDAKTQAQIPVGRIFAGVHPILYAILEATSDILDATSGYRSPNNMVEDFAKRGIFIVPDVAFDAAYAGAEDGLAYMRCFADPDKDFECLGIPLPREGEAWTDWKEIPKIDGDKMTISYEKHKKIELAFRAMAYGVNASTTATAPTFYKKVYNTTVIGFNDA